jgi:hypothetical protein
VLPGGGLQHHEERPHHAPVWRRDAEAVHLSVDGSRLAAPNMTITYLFASGKAHRVRLHPTADPDGTGARDPEQERLDIRAADVAQVLGTDDAAMVAAQQEFMRAMGPELEKVITTDTAAK